MGLAQFVKIGTVRINIETYRGLIVTFEAVATAYHTPKATFAFLSLPDRGRRND
jgi:hypothetical protein